MTDPHARRIDRLGRAIARAQDVVLEEHGVLDQVRGQIPRRMARPRRRLLRPALAAAVVLAAVVASTVALWPRPASLSFVAGDRAGEVGSWLAPNGNERLSVRFSDGTHIQFMARSGGRVQHVDANGARVLLEHGTAELTVVPRPTARWEIVAGPFHVHVLGTQFRLRWDPSTERFQLVLRRGTVRVSGPVLGTRVLHQGEVLRVHVPQGALHLSRLKAGTDPTSPQVPGRADRPEKAPPKANTPTPAAREAPANQGKSGTVRATTRTAQTGTDPSRVSRKALKQKGQPAAPLALVKAGRYRAALEAADRQGWARLLRRAPPSTLLALADASRLAGDPKRAWFIYTRVRQRFPRTKPAALAAFSLGRIAFDSRHDYKAAGGWFSTYLTERPNGSLAREALGRLIEARHRRGDRPRAKAAARAYLERYPDGPHARLAKRVVGGKP